MADGQVKVYRATDSVRASAGGGRDESRRCAAKWAYRKRHSIAGSSWRLDAPEVKKLPQSSRRSDARHGDAWRWEMVQNYDAYSGARGGDPHMDTQLAQLFAQYAAYKQMLDDRGSSAS
jgi:hypothetical protein